ncbi:MAG: hypothetical protein ACHQYP_10050, partial [Nitrospiria bacterium]
VKNAGHQRHNLKSYNCLLSFANLVSERTPLDRYFMVIRQFIPVPRAQGVLGDFLKKKKEEKWKKECG